LSSVTALDVRRGRDHMRGAKRGLLIGAGIGLGFALTTMVDSTQTTRSDDRTQMRESEYVGTMAVRGAIVGALIRALIGVERWNSYTFRARVSVGRSSASVGTTIRF